MKVIVATFNQEKTLVLCRCYASNFANVRFQLYAVLLLLTADCDDKFYLISLQLCEHAICNFCQTLQNIFSQKCLEFGKFGEGGGDMSSRSKTVEM